MIAAGTCATYGGIHAMEGNPTGCMGLADYLGWEWKSKAGIPIVCVPGLSDVFEPRQYFEWRGLGSIAHSGMKLRDKYSHYDAELKFSVPGLRVADPKACQCGEILKGAKKPWECKVFGTACTPETPIGSCMVSSEGACAAYYNFGRLSKIANRSASPAGSV